MRADTRTAHFYCDATSCSAEEHSPIRRVIDGHGEFPVEGLPEGWRERRTHTLRLQHACSAACERALIDAEG